MYKVALSGSSGRMGKAFQNLLSESSDFELKFCFSRSEPIENWKAEEIDLVIDFSLPSSFEKVFSWANENKTPLLSGTTGIENLESFVNSELKMPFMHSGNYSLGVASLIQSIKAFKRLSQKAQIWIEDYHHIEKLDAPSGTALKIKNEVEKTLNINADIQSARAGSIFGVHHLHIATAQEWVTLSHQALNREVFAEGALSASLWLVHQKPASYTLEDFLNS